MANEKDSRRPSGLLRHDDILEMLAKSYSRNSTVDMSTAIYFVSSLSNPEDRFYQTPLGLVDKKSKSEKYFVGIASQRRHTCQMMIQLLS